VIATRELLHSDLRRYRVTTNYGHGIASPLVEAMRITEGNDVWSIPWINKTYQRNKEYADDLIASRLWEKYVLFHRRHFRIHAFVSIESHLTDCEYWALLRDTWTDAETIWRNNGLWLQALTGRPSTRHLFTPPEDRAVWESLPNRFTINRGYQPGKNREGFSWTLDRATASMLSNHGKGSNLFDHNFLLSGGKIRGKKVNKSDVFAYTNSRGEQEIILLWNGNHYIKPQPVINV
jgi:hypothetical protein